MRKPSTAHSGSKTSILANDTAWHTIHRLNIKTTNVILLSFDTEEFDVPRENNVPYTLEEGMKVSIYGTNRILDILKANQVRATFFCTANFANNAPEVIQRIVDEGHEVACHGVDHWEPKDTDPAISKQENERISGVTCQGYRQPRMYAVSDEEIKRCGYIYNSSINPAFIPGHYMHLNLPRTAFMRDGVLQIPASVTPIIRFPMFWLALHNLPQWLYRLFVSWILRTDGYFTTYFHPWEFYHLKQHPEFRTKWIVRHNSGNALAQRLDCLIRHFKAKGQEFITYTEFTQRYKAEHAIS